MKYILIFLLSVFISSLAQIILKSSAKEKHDNFLREYLNVKVIVAYAIFFAATLITVYAYRYVPLSMGPILEASGYIYVSIMGYIFFKEKITKRKLAGLFLIFAGIVIFAL